MLNKSIPCLFQATKRCRVTKSDCEFEHLMIFAGDRVNKGKPRRFVKVETRNFSFELFNMSHSDSSEHKRTVSPSNEVTEFTVFTHTGIGNMRTNLYKAFQGTR